MIFVDVMNAGTEIRVSGDTYPIRNRLGIKWYRPKVQQAIKFLGRSCEPKESNALEKAVGGNSNCRSGGGNQGFRDRGPEAAGLYGTARQKCRGLCGLTSGGRPQFCWR